VFCKTFRQGKECPGAGDDHRPADKRKLYPKELKVGKGIPGKAVKAERVLRSHDFLSVPLIDEEAMGVITVYNKINDKPFTQFDQEIMMTIAEQAVIAIKECPAIPGTGKSGDKQPKIPGDYSGYKGIREFYTADSVCKDRACGRKRSGDGPG